LRLLITGASGLLGLNLALSAAGRTSSTEPAGVHEIFGVTHQHLLHNTPFHVLQADLLERGALERLLDTVQPDCVIHCAALANLDDCEADPDLAYHLNAKLPGRLATLVAKSGARAKPIRLVHISTDAVFDGARGDYGEEDTPNPLGVYARTKLAGERAVTAVNPQAIIARVNLFGWSLIGQRSLGEFFFNNLSAGKQVMGFTDVYFCPMLANDLAGILICMLEAQLSGLYHVVSREATSKYDFGVAVARRFGLDESLITPTPIAVSGLRAPRSPNLTLRTDKLRTALAQISELSPPSHPWGEKGGMRGELPSWQEGLERFYELYRSGYPQMLKQMAVAG
jgi:dTDP-4-dehydrorhamnose reductase